ncbi:MAG: hypothetical protein GY871_15010 [Actinomycetales bacterium]|nr:hypothetical protein [Actinomycetales bacterium]
MPQPDNRRERGGKTQSTGQKVAPSIAAPSFTSSIGSGAVNVGPALQINPNQARVVKTGGELAEAFAGLAGGIQKGIQNFETMEKKFEEMRYNEFETDMIRQAEATNSDPQKMKSWFESQEFKPGRHTSKRYYSARATVNGKAYQDDQMDWYRDTLNQGASMPLAERQKFLRERLDTLDENSPVYGKLDENVRADTAKLADANRKTRIGMLGKEMVADSQSAVQRIIKGGASPDIVHNDYFKNILRARNMGIVEVDDNGVITMTGTDRVISPTGMTKELNAELMIAMQERAQGMDQDLVMTQFGSINYDEGFLAAARQAGGKGSQADAVDAALTAGTAGGENSGGDMIQALTDSIAPNEKGDVNVDTVLRNFNQTLAASRDMGLEERRRWLASAETMLDEEAYGASWEALGTQFGMDGSLMTDGMRRQLRTQIRQERLAVISEDIETNAPHPSNYKTLGEYEKATKDFYYSAVGRMAETDADAMIDLTYTDAEGKSRGMTVQAENFRDFAARLQGVQVDEVSFRSKGVGPISFAKDENEIVTYGFESGDGEKVPYQSRHQKVDSARQRALKGLRAAEAFHNGGGGAAGTPARRDAFFEALSRDPRRALESLSASPDAGTLITGILADEDGKSKLQPILLDMVNPAKYMDDEGNTDMDQWKSSTLLVRNMMDQAGYDAVSKLLGADLEGPEMSRQSRRLMSMVEFGPQLADAGYNPEQLAAKLDEASRISEYRQTYPDRSGQLLDRALGLDVNDTSRKPTPDDRMLLHMNAELLAFVNAETGGEYTNLLDAQNSGDMSVRMALDTARAAFADSNAVSRLVLTDNQLSPASEDSFDNAAASKLAELLNRRRTSSNPRDYQTPDGRSVEQHAAESFLTQMEGNPEQTGTIFRTLLGDRYFDTYAYAGSEVSRGAAIPNNVAEAAMRKFAEEGPAATRELLAKFAAIGNPPANMLAERMRGIDTAVASLSGATPESALFTFQRNSTGDDFQPAFQTNADGERMNGQYTQRGFMFGLNAGRAKRDDAALIFKNFNDTVGGRAPVLRLHNPGAGYQAITSGRAAQEQFLEDARERAYQESIGRRGAAMPPR